MATIGFCTSTALVDNFTNLVLPVSIRMDANNFGIKVQAQVINILPLMDTLSDFADKDGWENLADRLAAAVEDLTIT